MQKIQLTALRTALSSLRAGLEPPPVNDRERDGAIQRFEYCVELTWKTGKRILHDMGIESLAPKTVIRELGAQGFIDDVETWIRFIDWRNELSHVYREAVAQQVYAQVPQFYAAAVQLLASFEHYVEHGKPA